jgi:hypothetical protein
LAHLRRQERQWFAWLTILHERLTKEDQGPLTNESLRVLQIAKKRWLEAKLALGERPQEAPAAKQIDPQPAPQTATCTGRLDS